MTNMIPHFIGLCLWLILGSGLALAQESNTAAPAAISKSATKTTTAKPKTASTTKPEKDAQALRKQQLLSLKEFTLIRVVDSIKEMDEAVLRMSARNQLLTFLSRGKVQAEADKALAAKIALDSLADFSAHSEEIPPFMASYLLSDLGAWIQNYRPELTEKFGSGAIVCC